MHSECFEKFKYNCYIWVKVAFSDILKKLTQCPHFSSESSECSVQSWRFKAALSQIRTFLRITARKSEFATYKPTFLFVILIINLPSH